MKRFSLTLVIVLISTLVAAAQKDPILIDSFGITPNGDFRGRADLFIQELRSTQYRDSRALIVVYGRPAQIESRKRLINNHFSFFRKFPLSRVEVKVGGNVSEFRTDFWLVPAGVAPPEIEPEAWVFREIGRANKAAVTKAISDLYVEANKFPRNQIYIINYGSPSQVDQRGRWIRNVRQFRHNDPSLRVLVNGGPGPVRTVMWLVPPGAANPTP